MASITYIDFVFEDGRVAGAPHGTPLCSPCGNNRTIEEVQVGEFVRINNRVGKVVEIGQHTVTGGTGGARTVIATLGE